jgi:hypothetical protein
MLFLFIIFITLFFGSGLDAMVGGMVGGMVGTIPGWGIISCALANRNDRRKEGELHCAKSCVTRFL